MRWLSDLAGSMRTTFGVGRATISSAGLTVPQTVSLPNKTGTIALADDLPADVRAVILAGLSNSSESSVVNTDSILAAIGKLQQRSLRGIPYAVSTDSVTLFGELTGQGWAPRIYGAGAGSRQSDHPDGQTTVAVGNGVANYYWVLTLGFGSLNLCQFAFPYLSGADNARATIKFRWRYGAAPGTWTLWDSIPRRSAFAAAQFSGIFASAAEGSVGNTWKKIRPASTDFDGIGGVLQTVSSEPTGVLLLPSAGIYELTAQLYPSAPANSSAKISLYLGLIDHGPTGALDSLLKVANQEFPGGQHPSVSLTRMVEISAARQYSFNWYFLDGAAVTSTMVLPTESVYSQVSVKRLA